MKAIIKNTIIFSCCVTMALGFLLPAQVSTVDLGDSMLTQTRSNAGYASADSTTFATMVGRVIKAAMSFLGVIFIALMVYGGFLWMTARGEDAQVTKAKDLIRAALIGIIIVVAAYSITHFVIEAIIGSASSDFGSDPGLTDPGSGTDPGGT